MIAIIDFFNLLIINKSQYDLREFFFLRTSHNKNILQHGFSDYKKGPHGFNTTDLSSSYFFIIISCKSEPFVSLRWYNIIIIVDSNNNNNNGSDLFVIN